MLLLVLPEAQAFPVPAQLRLVIFLIRGEKELSTGAQKQCPVCKMQRATTRTGVMTVHRRWNGKEMVPCKGSNKAPAGFLKKLLS